MVNKTRCRKCAKCAEVKKQTDELLFEAAKIFANEGKDSTPEEMAIAYEKEQEILLEVKRLDPELGASIMVYETDTEGPAEISE
jgi:hypothetical protein